jgi:hypothetical protein
VKRAGVGADNQICVIQQACELDEIGGRRHLDAWAGICHDRSRLLFFARTPYDDDWPIWLSQ